MRNLTRRRIAGLSSLVATAALAWPSAAAAEWRAGLARVDITPAQPLVMAGYGARVKPFEKVGSGLTVKVLVLDDGQGHRAALVTSDLLGFTAAIVEPICARLLTSAGLRREQILVNSSHTHTGPKLSLVEPRPDDPDAADAERTLDYTRRLQDQVVQAVERAAKALEPARLAWGSGVAHVAMNRREFTPDGVILGDNPRGLADRSVPVLAVGAPDGALRAVLFGAAAHNTTYACPLAVWQIGDLTLVGLSGEAVVDYVPLLEDALGPGRLWFAAYCNDVFGYLPSERVLAEGGYETRGLYAGAAGFFAPGVERVIVDGVRDLAIEAGRRVAAVPVDHDRAAVPAGLRP